MEDLININYNSDRPTCSARELWEFLERPYTKFTMWFDAYKGYGFTENEDYRKVSVKTYTPEGGTQNAVDYEITVEMAKELCMLQKTEKGKIARTYFLDLEKKWNSPEYVMARGLQMANRKIETLQTENLKLVSDNSALTVQNTTMKPKADYFDELVDRNLLTNFRDTAKELHVKQKELINFLLSRKYLYRDKKGNLKPYADKPSDLFEVKETLNEKTGWKGTQTLVTPKGRETFRLLFVSADGRASA